MNKKGMNHKENCKCKFCLGKAGFQKEHHVPQEWRENNTKIFKGKKISQEHKDKISNYRKGKKLSDSAKNKLRTIHIGKNNKMFGKTPWNKGLPMKEESKLKMSETRIKNGGYIVSEETRKKIRENAKTNPFFGMKGKKHTITTRIRLSESHKGHSRKHTEDSKRKLRLSTISYIQKRCGGISPRVGRNEKRLLDDLEKIFKMKIERQYKVNGYFIDGYIKELNLAIEVDEIVHTNNIYKTKDILREKEIKEKLGCKFLRIKDYG
ncbi:MAG: NUMOD3 domain-containing DNA-binding protein [Candidatus Omnitrophica bacterium]|jgi:hypothetical protein|nr:NUMOD3 domain-containing DNA-binding protein [Candidatus Omnitrophota bacterium]